MSAILILRLVSVGVACASFAVALMFGRMALRADDGTALLSGMFCGMTFLAVVAAVVPWS